MSSKTSDSSQKETSAEQGGSGSTSGAPAPARGLGTWLPLLVTLVAMPLLAYATTTFFLLPKIMSAAGHTPDPASTDGPAGAEGEKTEGEGDGKKAVATKNKVSVTLNKIVVNVAGTMGTRYLMTSLTLIGNNPAFKTSVDNNKDQLLDLAIGALGSKNIADLEKPGARNLIRTELISLFNNALGNGSVQEIYFTEFAIQ